MARRGDHERALAVVERDAAARAQKRADGHGRDEPLQRDAVAMHEDAAAIHDRMADRFDSN